MSASGTRDIERVGLGIGTEIASSRGRDEAGHSVVLWQGEEFAGTGFRRHAIVQQRFQPAGFLVEKTDGDQFKVQEVTREPANVSLEQLNAVGDAHLRQLLGIEGGQLSARLVQRVELLLLFDHTGRVVPESDEERTGRVGVQHRCDMQIDVPIIAAIEPTGDGGDSAAGCYTSACQRGMKRTEVGTGDSACPQCFVESPAHGIATAPALERRIRPAYVQVEIDDRDPVRDMGEHLVGLKESAQCSNERRVGKVGHQGVEVLVAQAVPSVRPGVGAHDLPAARRGPAASLAGEWG